MKRSATVLRMVLSLLSTHQWRSSPRRCWEHCSNGGPVSGTPLANNRLARPARSSGIATSLSPAPPSVSFERSTRRDQPGMSTSANSAPPHATSETAVPTAVSYRRWIDGSRLHPRRISRRCGSHLPIAIHTPDVGRRRCGPLDDRQASVTCGHVRRPSRRRLVSQLVFKCLRRVMSHGKQRTVAIQCAADSNKIVYGCRQRSRFTVKRPRVA